MRSKCTKNLIIDKKVKNYRLLVSSVHNSSSLSGSILSSEACCSIFFSTSKIFEK